MPSAVTHCRAACWKSAELFSANPPVKKTARHSCQRLHNSLWWGKCLFSKWKNLWTVLKSLTAESVLATVSQLPRVSVWFTRDGYSTGWSLVSASSVMRILSDVNIHHLQSYSNFSSNRCSASISRICHSQLTSPGRWKHFKVKGCDIIAVQASCAESQQVKSASVSHKYDTFMYL